MVDVGDMVGTAMPYLSAAAAAYGAGVVERVGEKAEVATADATARFGARLALLACAFFGLLVMHTVGHAL
jgi:hypothetical protein